MRGKFENAKGLFKKQSSDTYEEIEYKYFIPEKLNDGYQIKNPDIYLAVEQAVKTISELNAISEKLAHVNVFIDMIIKQEAVKSSSIEGTKTTFSEILMPENIFNEEKTRESLDRREVFNYIDAATDIPLLLHKLPICERLIKNLHATLLCCGRGSDKFPGEFRTVQNWIGGTSIKSADFIPIHQNLITEYMDDLCKFWNNQNIRLPILVKIALFHYQFETIHPFTDGNGRMGRLMILAQLLNSGFLKFARLNVSKIFEKNKANYTLELKKANLSGDLDRWILYFLDALICSAKNTYKIYHDYNQLQEQCTAKIISLRAKAQNAKKLLEKLYKTPYITVGKVSEELHITKQTASNLIKDFVKLKILVPFDFPSDKRKSGYVFKDYVSIFEED